MVDLPLINFLCALARSSTFKLGFCDESPTLTRACSLIVVKLVSVAYAFAWQKFSPQTTLAEADHRYTWILDVESFSESVLPNVVIIKCIMRIIKSGFDFQTFSPAHVEMRKYFDFPTKSSGKRV